MKIETKFDIGQKVYYLIGKFDNAIRSGEIIQIRYCGKEIIYEIEYNGNIQEEQYIFTTKSEAEQALKRLEGKDVKN